MSYIRHASAPLVYKVFSFTWALLPPRTPPSPFPPRTPPLSGLLRAVLCLRRSTRPPSRVNIGLYAYNRTKSRGCFEEKHGRQVPQYDLPRTFRRRSFYFGLISARARVRPRSKMTWKSGDGDHHCPAPRGEATGLRREPRIQGPPHVQVSSVSRRK